MPAAPPPNSAPPDDPVVALVAAQLGMDLPAECIAGVRQNLAVLAEHWAALRAVSQT